MSFLRWDLLYFLGGPSVLTYYFLASLWDHKRAQRQESRNDFFPFFDEMDLLYWGGFLGGALYFLVSNEME